MFRFNALHGNTRYYTTKTEKDDINNSRQIAIRNLNANNIDISTTKNLTSVQRNSLINDTRDTNCDKEIIRKVFYPEVFERATQIVAYVVHLFYYGN